MGSKAACCIELPDQPMDCCFSSSDPLVASALLDPSSGKAVTRLTKAHSAGINRLLGIPEQPSLLAAGDMDGGLCIWDLRSQQHVLKYNKHSDYISGLTVSEKQQALLAVSGDGTLSVHDLRSCKVLARSEDDADDELMSVAVVKNGKKVVCGSTSGVLAIWSWGYWNDCSDRFPGHPESVDALVTYDEDTLITGSSDGALRIVSILPNKLLGVLGEHEEDMPVERLAMAADKSLLASVSHDACVKLWDLSILQDDDEDDDEDDDAAAEDEEAAVAAGAGGDAAPGGPAAAAAAAAASEPGSSKRRPRAEDSDDSGSDGSDGDSSDDEGRGGSSRQRKKKREKTAMGKGRAKPSKTGNFFADLL
ncbi:hypothetical protein OEZ86_011597 [Tetradesmus obliquus]|nr:hypothetical protein OEZ86_011597 [Tetradesmus obliquus]